MIAPQERRRTAARGAAWVLVVATLVTLPYGVGGHLPPGAGSPTTDPSGHAVHAGSAGNAPVPRPAALTLTWANLTASVGTAPRPRQSAGMIWDSSDGYLLLFGGTQRSSLPFVYYNDTWSFSGGTWTNRTGTHAPSPRMGFGLADDPSDHGVLLFGGYSLKDSYLNDTWLYVHGNWTNVTSGTAPPGRFWGSLSYDNATGSEILFGGTEGGANQYVNDTWSYRAGVWTELAPVLAPPARDDQNQVADPGTGGVFLFGGENSVPGVLNDSWSFDGSSWTELRPANSPDPRGGPGLAYDPVLGDVILYGGYPASFYYYGTWVFAAGTWTDYAVPGAPPAGTIWGQMAFDPTDNEVILLEGDGDFNATFALTIASTGGGGGLAVQASLAPVTGAAPLEVNGTAGAGGGTPPYVYRWQFGDGSGSTGATAMHTYPRAGDYRVNLTVTDNATGHFAENWTVVVTAPLLTATIAADPTSSAPNQLVGFFSNATGGSAPYAWNWTFGDGATSTAQDPTHAYASVGTFTVHLRVTDSAGGSVNRSLSLTVQQTSGTGAQQNPSSGPSLFSGFDLFWLVLVLLAVIVAAYVVSRRRRRRPAPPGPSGATPPPPPP